MDSDSDRGILALGEDIVCRQESKAVGTDIIHGGRIFRIRIFELDGAGIVQIHTGVFTAVIDPGTGIYDDFEGIFDGMRFDSSDLGSNAQARASVMISMIELLSAP